MHKKPTPQELRAVLAHYYGSENIYSHSLSKLVYTDGARAFAINAGAYWFIDIVGTEIHPMNLEFAVVKLVSKDGAGSVVVEDGNGNTSWEKKIEFTDCPQGVWSFYLVNGTLLLPSEY